ncbi:MAG TPA: hypothetical protein VLE93_00340 [Candidatus Saccharimonadales bacterium]|nr:hypothetical protein [Candidatus Saccharimonadales bacterium]
MTNQLKFYLLLAGIGAVVIVLIFLFFPGSVTVTAIADSGLKAGATVTSDADNFKTGHSTPVTLKFHAGHHRLVVAPKDLLADLDHEQIFIWPLVTRQLVVHVQESELPGARGAAENPMLAFFPHITATYRVEGQFSSDLTTLLAVNLTIYHRSSSTDNTTYQAEHNQAITDARAYLATAQADPKTTLLISDQ